MFGSAMTVVSNSCPRTVTHMHSVVGGTSCLASVLRLGRQRVLLHGFVSGASSEVRRKGMGQWSVAAY